MIQPDDLYTLPLLPLLPAADLPTPAPVPAWRQALDAAIATDPRGKQGVAERMGDNCTRGYVSRVANGDLTARPPAKFIARVEQYLMRVDCPHLQTSLAPAECATYAARSYAQVSQFEVPHWRACRGCPNNKPAPLAVSQDPLVKAKAKLSAARAAKRQQVAAHFAQPVTVSDINATPTTPQGAPA